MMRIMVAVAAFAALFAFGVAQPASAGGGIVTGNNPLGNFFSGAGAGYGTAKVFGADDKAARIIGGVGGAVNVLTAPPPQQRYYQAPPPPPTYYQPPPPPQAYYGGPNCAPRVIAGAWCNVPKCWKACGGNFSSFREYDCTVVPYGSYRQRCTY